MHEKAVSRTQSNLDNLDCDAQRNHVDVFHWDATCLLLQDSSVDIFVTDLVSSTNVTVSVMVIWVLECSVFYVHLDKDFSFSGVSYHLHLLLK
jgi:hypothetical protein